MLARLTDRIYSWMWSESNPISSYHVYDILLNGLDHNSNILDVGTGSGLYFTNPKVIETIRSRNLHINCIDIDEAALEICASRSSIIGQSVTIQCLDLLQVQNQFDYILFVMSYPVIPNDLFQKYIKHASKICSKQIILFHNLVEEKGPIMNFIKPKIKYISGVDFGRLTSIKEMEDELNAWGFKNYNIDCIAAAKYRDVNPVLRFIPFIENLECKQYRITINL